MKYLFSIILLFSFSCFSTAKGKYHEYVFGTDSKLIYDACLSEHGEVIFCTDNNTLKAFSVHNKKLLANFTGGHQSKILCVAVSPDSTMLASGGSDSTVVIWDINSQSILQRITYATGKITDIKFSPDNQFLLFGCSNSRAYLNNIKAQKMLYEFTGQQKDVTSLTFSDDGNLIAIAGGDKMIRVYNTVDFKLKAALKGHTEWVRAIKFYNNDEKLISCGDDGKIIQWNLSKTDYVQTKASSNWILCVDIHSATEKNNEYYVFGSLSGNIKIIHGFGSYKAKLKTPVSKVLFLPNKNGLIELVTATLGSGLMIINARNM